MRALFRRVPAFDYLGVSGEVSEWTPRSNGLYFTLKDESTVLQCFAYHDKARRFPELPLGSAIIAYGAVRVADWRSRYELLVENVEFTGIGELYRQYEALKERFRKLGYFQPERKRPIPAFPRSVALVSARGKGAEDFLITLGDRAPQVRIRFVETRVQGIGADIEIADALDKARKSGVELIVLARGGGSYEDLFAFNREPVIQAIIRSTLPVVTGIGHTADRHLADDVADYVCETPSNAAQFIASLWQQGGEKLARLVLRLDREIRDQLVRAMERTDAADERLNAAWERSMWRRSHALAGVERRVSALNPALSLTRQVEQLTKLATALQSWPRHALEERKRFTDVRRERLQNLKESYFLKRRNALALAIGKLDSSDPLKPLERGYAIVSYDGRPIHDANTVTVGSLIAAKVFHGSLEARVESIFDDD